MKRPPTWDDAKKSLGDPNFMQKLMEFDKDKLDDGVLKKIGKFTSNPDFVPDTIGKVGGCGMQGVCPALGGKGWGGSGWSGSDALDNSTVPYKGAPSSRH